jgi:hypothetical protein
MHQCALVSPGLNGFSVSSHCLQHRRQTAALTLPLIKVIEDASITEREGNHAFSNFI